MAPWCTIDSCKRIVSSQLCCEFLGLGALGYTARGNSNEDGERVCEDYHVEVVEERRQGLGGVWVLHNLVAVGPYTSDP